MDIQYQLITLGPTKSQFHSVLTQEIHQRIQHIGLDSKRNFVILDASLACDIVWDNTPAGVWFGGTETSD